MNLVTRRDKFDKLLQDGSLKVESWQNILSTCPSCGYPTLGGRANYNICPLCGWEDTGQDDPDADQIEGGPNGGLSLNESRKIFERKFASNRMLIKTDPMDTIRVQLINLFDSLVDDESVNSTAMCKKISTLFKDFNKLLSKKAHEYSRLVEIERTKRDRLIEKSRNRIDTILMDFNILFKENENTDSLVSRVMLDMRYQPYNQDLKVKIIKKYSLSERKFDQIKENILDQYEKFKPLWEILPLLRKNYKLGTIEDTELSISQLLREKFDIDHFIDFVYIPEKPYAKSENQTYKYMLSKLGSTPQSTLFINQGYDSEIINQMGIHLISWNDRQAGLDKLRRLFHISSIKNDRH